MYNEEVSYLRYKLEQSEWRVETLKRGYEVMKDCALRIKKERDQLEEIVTFLESELRRERGYV